MKRQFIFLSVIVVILAGCKEREVVLVDNLVGGNIWAIGHGGAGFETFRNSLPANSMASLQQAVNIEEADGIEFDIRLSQEGIPVLFHNEDLSPDTDCKGCLENLSLTELEKCKYYSRNGPLDGKFHIVSLDSVFYWISGLEKKPALFLNLKVPNHCQNNFDYSEFAESVDEVVLKYDLEEKVVVETNSLDLLKEVRKVNPNLKLLLDGLNFEVDVERAMANKLWGLALTNQAVTAVEVNLAHQRGLKIIIWGVKLLPDTRKAIAKNPDGILTDDLRMLRSRLK